MPIRITGMNSGLDTEALVSGLVSAYRAKGDKITKAQTKVSWKQEAWKTMSSKTFTFRNKLDSMRFSSGYNLKTTSVSNASKASVTAGNNAVNGTQTLEIKAGQDRLSYRRKATEHRRESSNRSDDHERSGNER